MDPLPPGRLSRAVRQALESCRAAGLEHLARVAPPTTAVIPEPAAPTRTDPVPTGRVNAGVVTSPPELERSPIQEPVVLANLSTETAAEITRPETMPTRSPPPAPVTPAPPVFKPVAGRDARLAALEVINERVRECRKCTELANTRTRTVFGVGDPETSILFLGEAPGADEDAQGEPFVGKAGQLLNQIISACLLKREEIYICNVLKCRPPGNRVPAETECVNCREYLDGQIAIIDPAYIVCWGTVAAQNLLGTKQPIGRLRRQFFRHGNAKVVCTYHPSYLLRNPAAKKDVWEDMKFWRAEMGIDLSGVGKQT
ncbi:MAG: uracil-DNA glycosylase [Planctomycetaceae bacterium]|nr:MAG: uracil-DNA glycosylase [Planctomycetaceae bacterium]